MQPSGKILVKYELLNRPTRHPTRDVSALEFLDEAHALDDIRSRGVPFSPLALRTTPLERGEAVDIVGYEVEVEEKTTADDSAEEMEGHGDKGANSVNEGDAFEEIRGRADPNMVMRRPRGVLAVRTPKQAFVMANADLQAGMCGGAVLDMDLGCCGCVEGVVPPVPAGAAVSEDRRMLQGAACIVESMDLLEFLRDDDVFSF